MIVLYPRSFGEKGFQILGRLVRIGGEEVRDPFRITHKDADSGRRNRPCAVQKRRTALHPLRRPYSLCRRVSDLSAFPAMA